MSFFMFCFMFCFLRICLGLRAVLQRSTPGYLLSAAALGEGLLSGTLAVEVDAAVSFECPLPLAELSNEELSEESLLGDPFRA